MKQHNKQLLNVLLTCTCATVFIGAAHAAEKNQTATHCYTAIVGKKFETTTTPEPANYTTAAGEKRAYPTTVTTHEIEAAPELREGSFLLKSTDASTVRSQLYQLSDSHLERLMLVQEYSKGGSTTFAHANWQRSRALKVGDTETLAYSVATLGSDTPPDEIKARYVFEAIEDLRTPAGTFKNACRFKTLSSETVPGSGKPFIAITESGVIHFAPGYGIVRAVTNYRYVDGRQSATVVNTTVATRLLNR
jgi:hypothetical protein